MIFKQIPTNSREGVDSRFQRAVVYRRLPESVAREFESISKEKAGQLLVELNQWLAEKKGVAGSDSAFIYLKKYYLAATLTNNRQKPTKSKRRV